MNEIRSTWGQFLSTLGDGAWQYFITLTLLPSYLYQSNSRHGIRSLRGRWWRFIESVLEASGCAVDPKVFNGIEWVAVAEPHISGQPHLHVLMRGVRLTRREIQNLARRQFGLSKIVDFDPTKGAAWYVSKMLAADESDVRFDTMTAAHGHVGEF